MVHSILAPLDGSAFGEHALPLALFLARKAGARLAVLHVAPAVSALDAEGSAWLDDSVSAELQRRARVYLEGVVRRLHGVSAAPVTCITGQGDIGDCIHEQAVHSGADLVVMATHGRGPLARCWLGGVADETVRRLPVPVLLVRPREEPPDLTAEPNLARVLVPLDGTRLAEQILGDAAVVAALAPGSEVLLLRVVKPALGREYLPYGPAAEREARSLLSQSDALQRQIIAEAEAYLGEVAKGLRERGLRVQTLLAVGEQPALAILKEAADRQVGLIALQTHGRRGLSRLILGSVADKVLRGSPVPVLLHRPTPV
jgi:nucleotide-binding universal stress UspA family protein